MDIFEGDGEGFGADLGHFGMEALTHFCAAVGDEDGAVVVDVNEGTGLVEEDGGEGDAEFGGDDGDAPFLPFGFGVVGGNCFFATVVICVREDLLVHERDVPVLEGLVEVGDFIGLVHVDLSKSFYGHVEMICDFLHKRLGDEHSLWTTKSTKRCVRNRVGLRYTTPYMDIGEKVTSVYM